jgi:ferredoxin-NADP reductase
MTGINRPSPPKRLEWQLAQVRDVVAETLHVKSLILKPASWPGHLPGQHVDIRLTDEDGYQAQRSYSISSPPEDELLALTVERVKDGEVSPDLLDELRVCDQLDLRGPIGGYFVWTGDAMRPVYLLAGGTGVTPLMSMLRHRDRQPSRPPALLTYSARTWEDIVYRDELKAMMRRDSSFRLVYALTRQQPEDWTGHRGRITKGLLSANWFPPAHNPVIYVCGPTSFVETAANFLQNLDLTLSASRQNDLVRSGG